jgi:hypothetical protein
VNIIFESIEEVNNKVNEEMCEGNKEGRRNENRLPKEPA